MPVPLFAADWDALIKVGAFIVVGIYWLITAFTKKAEQPAPRRPTPIDVRPPQEEPQAADPLQAEIDDFLRKAQAQREGRPVEVERPSPQPVAEAPRRQRPKRRSSGSSTRRVSPPQPQSTSPVVPVVVEAVEVERPRESLAEQLAHRPERSVFDQRTRPLSQVQQASDSEFQQHMQKVFDHDLGQLKPTVMGMFEAAGAAAAAAATQAATAAAAGAQSSTAPSTVRARTSDIALFLAGKKNIRDAIVLTEVLRRPDDRW